MAEKFANFCATTLAANAATGDLTITVASSANVPSLGASDFFRVTLIRAADGFKEIVKVTGVSGTTWTVTRAQESTTALALVTGDIAIHRLTAGAADAMSTRDSVALGTPAGSATVKTVLATVSRAGYFRMMWRLLDSAVPAAVPTLVPTTGSTVVEGEIATAAAGTYTFTFTHTGANRNWYLAVCIGGEWTVSSVINLG